MNSTNTGTGGIFSRAFCVYEDRVHVLVTGSAHLNVFKRAGDSLMGRYFPYTLHPLSVAECAGREAAEPLVQSPVASMKTSGRRYGAMGVSRTVPEG